MANPSGGCTGTGNPGHYATFSTANKVVTSDQGATPNGPLVYDVAGNVMQDAVNKYVYDPEGRICAVENIVANTAKQYVYDAEGRRMAKGTLSGTFPTTGCAAPTAANGFTLTATYLRGAAGGQDAEIDSNGAWHQNVYADGGLLATYTASSSTAAPALYFNFNDWLGTKRLQVNQAGQAVNYWASDPFGDYLTAHVTNTDASQQHFTGKVYDHEPRTASSAPLSDDLEGVVLGVS